MDYDDVVITILDTNKHLRRVHIKGYIGFEYNGLWDEMIILSMRVKQSDNYAQAAWQSIQDRFSGAPPLSGSPARNAATNWLTLEIEFSDGAVLRCAGASILEE